MRWGDLQMQGSSAAGMMRMIGYFVVTIPLAILAGQRADTLGG
jgi:hypothetical protein